MDDDKWLAKLEEMGMSKAKKEIRAGRINDRRKLEIAQGWLNDEEKKQIAEAESRVEKREEEHLILARGAIDEARKANRIAQSARNISWLAFGISLFGVVTVILTSLYNFCKSP